MAQTLARHSTFALTMDRYSHLGDGGEQVKALQVLPTLPELKVTAPNGAAQRAPRTPKQKAELPTATKVSWRSAWRNWRA